MTEDRRGMDWATVAPKTQFSIGLRPTTNLVFSPDGTQIAVVRSDMFAVGNRDFSVWRVSDSQMLFEAGDHSINPRAAVHFSPDGRHLVVPCYDGIHVWRTSDWQRYETFATTVFSDAVFMPQSPNQGVLEISTGVVWCSP
jgi:WD40 repeat protein